MKKFIKIIKNLLIYVLKFYILLTLIFTPYYLYRFSYFKSSSCIDVFLKLDKHNIKIYKKITDIDLKYIKGSKFNPTYPIFMYGSPGYVKLVGGPKLKINSCDNFYSKCYWVSFKFMTFVYIPDLKTFGSYGITFVCFSYSPYETYYDLYYIDYHYALNDVRKILYKPNEVNENILIKNLTAWYEHEITPEDKKYIDYVNNKILNFLNDNEKIKLNFIEEYFIKLKYSFSVPLANEVWFLEKIELHPTPFSYLNYIYNWLCPYISLPWLPIFLLIPKNFFLTFIFYYIWLILIVILFIKLRKSKNKI